MYDLLSILFKFCSDGTTNVMPFCLPAKVYIELFCIIAGTLSMFSARGCVPDTAPGSVRGNTVRGGLIGYVKSKPLGNGQIISIDVLVIVMIIAVFHKKLI